MKRFVEVYSLVIFSICLLLVWYNFAPAVSEATQKYSAQKLKTKKAWVNQKGGEPKSEFVRKT
ncbi:MAG: hypothetical protein EOP04_27265 [Proteobacteria bacterium]|nr:MAG: hypothetical protein EOP04_27265 [Pseudomonadota bacterium]